MEEHQKIIEDAQIRIQVPYDQLKRQVQELVDKIGVDNAAKGLQWPAIWIVKIINSK